MMDRNIRDEKWKGYRKQKDKWREDKWRREAWLRAERGRNREEERDKELINRLGL